MENLPIEAMITILLFLIGAPALLIQNSESEVRYALSHNLLRYTFATTGLPVLGGVLILVYALIAQPSGRAAIVVVLGMLLLSLIVAIIGLPVSRKREVVKRLRGKMVGEVRRAGRVDDEDMKALVLMGMESRPGDERWWAIHALGYITTAFLNRSDYNGCRLDKVMEALRKIIFGSGQIGSPENFLSVVEVLRPVILKYYQMSKNDAWFSDADLSNAYRLLSDMGQRAVEFPVDGVTSACIDALDGLGATNSSASQGLCEIGIAAVAQNRIGPAREALHILDAIVTMNDELCEDEEIIFDYLALLAAIWHHSMAGTREAKRYLDDLYFRDQPSEEDPPPVEGEPPAPKPERLLSRLVRQAVQHHTTVGRFRIASDIYAMWEEYQA